MTYWMGIDGGGSTIRTVIVDDTLNVIAQVERAERVNPGGVGHEAAATTIQAVIRNALTQSGVHVSGVGIGVAGASALHSEVWLREVVAGVLPDVFVAPSSDHEIALVGAVGERRGILLLSGTGSVAYGVNAAGEARQVGGWGYLLGDEGSGYWFGVQAIRALLLWADGRAELEPLARRIMAHLNLVQPRDVIRWLYQQPPPLSDVAACAPLMLEAAEHKGEDNSLAVHTVQTGAAALILLVQQIQAWLHAPDLPIAFAGSLLREDNALSREVCCSLHLQTRPVPLYSSVVGAALLAKLQQEKP